MISATQNKDHSVLHSKEDPIQHKTEDLNQVTSYLQRTHSRLVNIFHNNLSLHSTNKV